MVGGFTFRGDRARTPAPGTPGDPGKSAYQIAVDNGFIGTEADWLASLVGPASTVPGPAATISVNSTTTGAPGSNASVVNVGTSSAAQLNFTIPRGEDGTHGSAATVTVGTTTTGTPTTPASVTNVGTTNAAVLNFVIPKGEQGPSGISKRIVTMSGLTSGAGVVSFTYTPEFANVPHVSISFIAGGSTREFARLSASTRFGCTVQAFSQNATLLSLLGIDILTAGTTAINGATIRIMATEM